jgi:hypothetical protein
VASPEKQGCRLLIAEKPFLFPVVQGGKETGNIHAGQAGGKGVGF